MTEIVSVPLVVSSRDEGETTYKEENQPTEESRQRFFSLELTFLGSLYLLGTGISRRKNGRILTIRKLGKRGKPDA